MKMTRHDQSSPVFCMDSTTAPGVSSCAAGSPFEDAAWALPFVAPGVCSLPLGMLSVKYIPSEYVWSAGNASYPKEKDQLSRVVLQRQQHCCQWFKGFLNPEMFVRNCIVQFASLRRFPTCSYSYYTNLLNMCCWLRKEDSSPNTGLHTGIAA